MASLGRELTAQIREEMRRNRVEREQARAFYGQQVDLMRQQHDLMRDVVRDNATAFREGSRLVSEVGSELAGALRELRAEVRAQSEAIFKLIDRLDGGASPSEAG